MRRPAPLALLAALLAACESSPEIPTALEGPPPFSRVVFDQTTISPLPGTPLSVGQTIDYRADAYFELAPADLQQNPWQSASMLLESWDRGSDLSYFSEGDWREEWTALEDGATSGTVSLSGTLTVPATSPGCTSFDEIHITATLGFSEEPQQVSDKSPGSGLEARAIYPVTGTGEATDPCVQHNAWVKNFTWAAGEDVLLFVDNVNASQELSVRFGGGPEAVLLERTDFTFSRTAWLKAFIPPGSSDGSVEVFVDGEPAVSGGGITTEYPIPDPTVDWGDPFNDRGWDFAWRSFTSYPDDRIHFWNPALVFSPGDREVNADWNPWGLTEYGVGDWWKFEWGETGSLCIELTFDPADEATFFFTSVGNLVFDEKTVEPGRVWMEIPVLNPPVDGSVGQIEIWAAPRNVSTALGAYGLAAASCDWPGFTRPAGASPAPEGPPLRLPAR